MKIIHYCWFGGPVPEKIKRNVDGWRACHPQWQVMEWNERSIQISDCEYALGCLARQDWAYLSDYVRLQALAKYGGVYLDTDVEVRKPFDPLLQPRFSIGYMHNCALGTAVILAPPHDPLTNRLLKYYQALGPVAGRNNNAILTEFFLEQLPGFHLDGKRWESNGVSVYPRTWFEQPTLSHSGGYSIHHFHASWSNHGTAYLQKQAAGRHLAFVLKRTLRCWREQFRCDYFPIYLHDRYHLPVRRRMRGSANPEH